jgi:hypothetical protein
MEGLGIAAIALSIAFYLCFTQYLQHNRRVLVHRERLAAIEKGTPLPAEAAAAFSPEAERRRSWYVQRLLLLAGLVWLSIGISTFVVLSAIFAANSPAAAEVPRGLQWIGLAPATIGLSHLIVYAVGRSRER